VVSVGVRAGCQRPGMAQLIPCGARKLRKPVGSYACAG
jgi:hypothetical protein